MLFWTHARDERKMEKGKGVTDLLAADTDEGDDHADCGAQRDAHEHVAPRQDVRDEGRVRVLCEEW